MCEMIKFDLLHNFNEYFSFVSLFSMCSNIQNEVNRVFFRKFILFWEVFSNLFSYEIYSSAHYILYTLNFFIRFWIRQFQAYALLRDGEHLNRKRLMLFSTSLDHIFLLHTLKSCFRLFDNAFQLSTHFDFHDDGVRNQRP